MPIVIAHTFQLLDYIQALQLSECFLEHKHQLARSFCCHVFGAGQLFPSLLSEAFLQGAGMLMRQILKQI